jgi:pimeloyl-ACP methyl ester carboxylesterase
LPYITLNSTPLNLSAGPVEIFYREYGRGIPLIFLHSGWGYQIYHFDVQIAAFADRFRIIIPDRTGYGRSPRISEFPPAFHTAAAEETLALLDALGIEQAFFWGHSDGAVIAALIALMAPARCQGVIMEAFHYDRAKPASREFFETMATAPENFGARISEILAKDHGADYWRQVLQMDGRAWLKIAAESDDPSKDFFNNNLSEISVPAIFIHGSRDPRTEEDELARVRALLPAVPINLILGGGHSPHSSAETALECNQFADEFFQSVLNKK